MKKIYILIFVSSILSATEVYLEKYDVTVIDETYSSSANGVYYFSCSVPDVDQSTASYSYSTDTYIHALELAYSRSNLSSCLYKKPDCTPEPAPDGLLTILPSLASDVCNDYVSKGTYTLTDTNTTYTDLFCYVDTCSNDLTDVVLMGKIFLCEPLSEFPLSGVSSSSCSGSATNYSFGVTGVAVFNECDNTCYLTETLPLDCSIYQTPELFEAMAKSNGCDLTKNNFKITCTATSSTTPPILETTCTSKSDPCVPIRADFALKCQAPKVINGDCVSNGYTITSNTLSCDSPDPLQLPCDIAFDNIKKTCLPPNKIEGSCTDKDGVILDGMNTLKCVPPNDDNTTSSDGTSTDNNTTLDSEQLKKIADNINSLNSNLSANVDKVINHIKKLEDNTKKASSSLKSIDSKISTLISNSSSIDSRLQNASGKLDTIASNTALTANKLSSIQGTLDDMNNKTGSFDDGVSSLNIDNIDIDTQPLDNSSNIMDNLEANLAYLTSDVTSIKDDFTSLKDMLEGDQSTLVVQSGSCSDENMQKFASYIAPYSPIFSLLTYVSFMFMIFKTIFQYLGRGEN